MAVVAPPGCSFVQATDSDTDGLSIGAGALPLNGRPIQDDNGNVVMLNLSGYTIFDAASSKVDDNVDRAPTVPQRAPVCQPAELGNVRRG